MKLTSPLEHPALNQLRLEMGAEIVPAPARARAPRLLDPEMIRNLGKPPAPKMPKGTGAPPAKKLAALAPVPTKYRRSGDSKILDPEPPKDGKPWAKTEAEYVAMQAARRSSPLPVSASLPLPPAAPPSTSSTPVPTDPPLAEPAFVSILSAPLVYGAPPPLAPIEPPVDSAESNASKPASPTPESKPTARRNQAILDRLKDAD